MLVTLLRDGHAGQTAAGSKCPIPNARNAVSDSNAGQTAAKNKRIIPNTRNAVRDGHAGQTDATIKRIIPNAYHRHAVYCSWDNNRSRTVETNYIW